MTVYLTPPATSPAFKAAAAAYFEAKGLGASSETCSEVAKRVYAAEKTKAVA